MPDHLRPRAPRAASEMPYSALSQLHDVALAAVLDQVPDALSVFDGEWRYRFVNAAAAELLRRGGVEPTSALGRPLWEVLPALQGSTVEAGLREAVRDGRVTSVTARFGAAGHWYETRCVPTQTGAVTIVRDVSVVREAEAALARAHDEARAAERRARLLAETSDVLAAASDPDAALERVARLVVPVVSDWCAVDVLEDDGRIRRVATVHRDPERERWAMAVHDSVAPRLDDASGIGLVVRTGEPFFAPDIPPGLLEELTPSARHREVWREMRMRSAITVPLTARGRTFGALTLIQSESGRLFGGDDLELAAELARRAALALDGARLLAAAEQARRQAEAASLAKTEFLAVMSHELRTPLNAIAGYAELLEMEIHGPVTDEQRHALARIRRSGHHLLGLINDVLNFAKLETNAVRYELRELPVGELVDGLDALVAPQLAARQLRLSVELRDPMLAVRADPEKARQVLLNLLTNAIKFTPSGGTITVGASRLGGRVAVRVRDTGIGIAPEQLERIFDPFVQIDRALNNPREGAGLGLAISRDLARGMGGDLRVESALQRGTTFSLLLPAAARPASREAAAAAPGHR